MRNRELDYFVTIVETGSLTRAAEKLYVSQPYLSQYLKKLEKSLGVTLFDRTTSPMKLTYPGERYYRHVLQVNRMNENMRKELQDIQSDTGGKLRLGVALWRGACLLPDVFPGFYRTFPNIKLELTEGSSNLLKAALMNDRIDIAVLNLPHALDYSNLMCELICRERILLAAPSNHPAVQEVLQNCEYRQSYPVAPLKLLREIPLISTKQGQNLTHEIMYTLGKHNIEPNILLETANLTTAINLAAKGIGCVFVPEEGAKVCQRPEHVVYFLTDAEELVWDLGVLYRRDTYLPGSARVFIDMAKAQFCE